MFTNSGFRVPFISRYFGVAATAITLLAGACSAPQQDHKAPAEFTIGDGSGKADEGSSASIVRDVDLNSEVVGNFDAHRTYGMTFSAKAGAVLSFKVTATAGADSVDVAPGGALDTVLAVYGPLTADGQRGKRLISSDDDSSGVQGQLPALTVAADGEYLFVLSTWNDPGHGKYSLELDCAGTDFQCRRPVQTVPCDAKTRYIVGGTTVETDTWSQCKVVLLESTTVAADAILTINPGVNVQGNYLGTGTYGTVQLNVLGKLQAVGTSDAPIVFSAIDGKTGWGGIVLSGDSNTLSNVFIESANVGLHTAGNNNTFTDLVIDTGTTGILVDASSTTNEVQRVKIDKVQNGVQIAGAANVEDSVILSHTANGVGIALTNTKTKSTFSRAIVSGFDFGLSINGSELAVADATITNNHKGIYVTGPNAGLHPAVAGCPAEPVVTPAPARYWPAYPTIWGRDPSFVRCDIIKNSEYGVKLDAPQLLVVDSSNVRDNGAGIIVATDSLNAASHITNNNIFNNGTSGVQVESSHDQGTLDISNNYWAQISDPQLSASWLMHHNGTAPTCQYSTNGYSPNGYTSVSGIEWYSNTYSCGPASSFNWNGSVCSATVPGIAWDSPYTFTGFSPVQLTAGPNTSACVAAVIAERNAEGL